MLAICLLVIGVVDKQQESQATSQTRVIVAAMQKYQIEHNRWPIQTFDIVDYLENGKKDLIDPWGKPYQYVLGEQKPGVVRPYIWTERVVGKETKVYGMKPPEEMKK